jgi:carbonic anhydrase
MPRLVDNIRVAVAAVGRAHPHLKGQELVSEAVEANVWQAIEDLFLRSPIARGRAKAGALRVVGAIYDIATGKVEWLGEHPDQARLLG